MHFGIMLRIDIEGSNRVLVPRDLPGAGAATASAYSTREGGELGIVGDAWRVLEIIYSKSNTNKNIRGI